MNNTHIQALTDGTGIVVSHDFDMGIGVIAGPRILTRLTKEQVNKIKGAQHADTLDRN